MMAPTQTPIQNDAKPDLGPPLSAFAVVLLLNFRAYFCISNVQDQKILLLIACFTVIVVYSRIIYSVNWSGLEREKPEISKKRKLINYANGYPLLYVSMLFMKYYTPLMSSDRLKPLTPLLMFMVFHRMGTASERRKRRDGAKTDIGTSNSETK